MDAKAILASLERMRASLRAQYEDTASNVIVSYCEVQALRHKILEVWPRAKFVRKPRPARSIWQVVDQNMVVLQVIVTTAEMPRGSLYLMESEAQMCERLFGYGKY